jgi:hypothetical protein
MHLIVWKFRPRAGSYVRFLEAYGPEGSWSKLFRKSPDYLGTELLRLVDGSDLFMTIDRWRSAKGYEAFLAARRDEYDELDEACENLTESEALLGRFDEVC